MGGFFLVAASVVGKTLNLESNLYLSVRVVEVL